MHIPSEIVIFNRARQRTQDRVADRITRFSGSMLFVYLHVGWFAYWIVHNTLSPWPFDPFPFGLLTLIVSLEAIFLATFVMISQNREAQRAEIRAQLDFETNVVAEAWVETIAAKLGIDPEMIHTTVRERMAEANRRQGDRRKDRGHAGDASIGTEYLRRHPAPSSAAASPSGQPENA
jgi:uncharacterized membrane protein